LIAFTTVQLFTASLVAMGGAFFLGSPAISYHPTVWWALGYTAIFATALAFVVQTKVQHFTSPTHAALIFSLEAVFTTVMGWLWLNESLTRHEMAGCALMGLGTVVVQLKERPKPSKKINGGYYS
jgi:drug/metabolite transporter (DMT)-like permease